MKKRFLAGVCLLCVMLSGCGKGKNPPKNTEKTPLPSRTLLVVPYDHTGAQAFVLLRFSSEGTLTVSSYPRETVFCPKSTEETTFYALFANGGPVGFSHIVSAFSESGIPVDRVLSVDVSDSDSALYSALSATGNNLLFTNPPAFVYTIGMLTRRGENVAISASQLRRFLSLPAENFGRPEEYAAFRGYVAIAVLCAAFFADSDKDSDGFFARICSGSSTISPADEAVFSPFLSPSPTVLYRPVSGEFVGVGTHKRFYWILD